ncbi:MAG: methionine biosynthesis PLP-dependent protein [Planctomycetota bacterium]|nr:MAG: methionine biosynthesis PLP-dependent protein [Planctomycetota bacterium]
MKTATQLVQGGRLPEDPLQASAPPLYQTATFRQASPLQAGAFDYSRSGNPTRRILEQQLAELEGGVQAFAFSSGMAAINAVTRLVPRGGRILAGHDVYGGTWRLLEQVVKPSGVEVEWIEPASLAETADRLQAGADLVLVETPTNPRMQVCDLQALARLCHEFHCLLAVDNSWMTPLRQNPLALGADLVVHSATKFLGGHGDLTAGAVVVQDSELADRLAFLQNAEGTALAPFDSWLLLRGMKTLEIRLRQQEASARKIVRALKQIPEIRNLRHPSLLDSPSRKLHRSQARGDGSLIALETGSLERSVAFLQRLQCFSLTVSFGSVASSASLPCRMSHAAIPEHERQARGLPEDLIRLSIGIEDPGDLIADLSQALDGLKGRGSLSTCVSQGAA